MEARTLVVERHATVPGALLPSAEGAEVLRRLRGLVGRQLEGDATSLLRTDLTRVWAFPTTFTV